jgi:PAS domain S-box-containing protein
MESEDLSLKKFTHELKNIMAVIKLYAQMGMHDATAGEILKEHLGIILNQASEAIKLTGRLSPESANKAKPKHPASLDILLSNLPGIAYRCTNAPGWPMEFISEGCLQLTGYQPEAFIGKHDFHYEDIIHPDDRKYVNDVIQECVKQGQPFTIEYRIRTKDGGEKRVWEKGRQVSSDNDSTCYLEGFIMEITELKRLEEEHLKLEEQLMQSQKMETIGKLAGGVAHEFNNTLQVINTLSELSLLQLGEGSPVAGHLQQIRTSIKQSSAFVGQLLAFARKQPFNPEIIDFNTFMDENYLMLRKLVGETISLEWNRIELLWKVKLDPYQLNQVLINLVVNARDAINGNGLIRISAYNEKLTRPIVYGEQECREGEYFRLSVSDNGSGMNAETMSRIFEPFFTTKAKGKGTGLGLATVYGIVRQNGGFIFVDSTPGQGTTFRIYIPALNTR